jgi:predicted enzyme related to lactoylglutathione lyase
MKGVVQVTRRLSWTTIWSEDHTRLLPFYRDLLGMVVSEDSGGFAVLGDANTAALCLGTHSEVSGTARDPYRHMVGLDSDDLDGDVRRLKDAGVEVIEEPTAYGDMRMATVRDPEGNIVQLSQAGA